MLKSIVFFALVLLPVTIFAQPAAQPVRLVKLTHFTLQSSAVIKSGGDALSSTRYTAKDYCFPVTVPLYRAHRSGRQ